MARLRLKQSVAAVFFLPHYVAQELGAFRDQGLTVDLTTSFYGQQWAALESGEADLTAGGPMRTMWLQAREGHRMVNFCLAARANPWYLVGRNPSFAWPALVGGTVIDFSDSPTPRHCFLWVLQQQGIRADQVTLLSGLGTAREVEAFRAGQGDYLLHSLHTAAPLVVRGVGVLAQELATPTGPVPFSAYATLPAILSSKEAELEAFVRGIARALRWIAAHPAEDLARLVAHHFPDFTRPVLADAIARYQALNLWPIDPLIPQADFEHFRSILLATGWLPRPVPYEDQVDTSLAARATSALGPSDRSHSRSPTP